MEIKRLSKNDKQLIKQCDLYLLEFLKSEESYDINVEIPNKTKSFLNDVTDDDKMIIVAVEENKVNGFLYAYIYNKKTYKSSVAHLSFLFVKENNRQRGIASSLIEEFLKIVKERQIKFVEVNCFEKDEVARRLYKKHGFEVLWLGCRKELQIFSKMVKSKNQNLLLQIKIFLILDKLSLTFM